MKLEHTKGVIRSREKKKGNTTKSQKGQKNKQ
jgi:hypothetical protein